MSDSQRGDDSLDKFIESLARDPNAPAPSDLDPELVEFLRALALTEQTPQKPLSDRTKARMWAQALSATMREKQAVTHHHNGNRRAINTDSEKQPLRDVEMTRRPMGRSSGTRRSGFLIALAAGIALLIFASALWAVLVDRNHDNVGTGDLTSTVTPTSVATAVSTATATEGATIIVNSTDDAPLGCPQTCSLRAAIGEAKDGAVISFGAGVRGVIKLHDTLVIRHNISIVGPGAQLLAIDGGDEVRIFDVDQVTMTLSGLTLQHGQTLLPGGAVVNGSRGKLRLADCLILDNSASSGAGVANLGGQLIVNSVTFSENTATGRGGAIFSDGGKVTVTGSTFTDNSAVVAGGGLGINKDAAAEILNSTFANNSTVGNGGAVANEEGQLSITSSTFYENSALVDGGGIASQTPFILKSTIVAGNSASKDGPDIWGKVESRGFNLIGNSSQGSGFTSSDQLDIDPHLLELALNAPGTTSTVALEPGSMAIGKGGSDCPATDQRGVKRKNPCDVGAYESATP